MADTDPTPTFEETRERLSLCCYQMRQAVSAGESKVSTYAVALFGLLQRSALPWEKQREILAMTDNLIQAKIRQCETETMTQEGKGQNEADAMTERGDGQSEADSMTELGDERSEADTVTLAGDEQIEADRARDVEEEVYTLTSLTVLNSYWSREQRQDLLGLINILREKQVDGSAAD